MLWCYNGTYCGTDRVTHCDADSSAHARAHSRPDDIVCTDPIAHSHTDTSAYPDSNCSTFCIADHGTKCSTYGCAICGSVSCTDSISSLSSVAVPRAPKRLRVGPDGGCSGMPSGPGHTSRG